MPSANGSRAALIESLAGVAGWLTDDEAWMLHELARTHRPDRRAITAVELGSWQGRSTIVLASGLRARGAGVVFAVDPHRDSRLHRATGVSDTFAAFQANVEASGLSDHVIPIRATSLEGRRDFPDRGVDLLFIDASHLYEDVIADLTAWDSALAEDGVVAFHDARDEPGVARALAEHVLAPGSRYVLRSAVDNLVVVGR